MECLILSLSMLPYLSQTHSLFPHPTHPTHTSNSSPLLLLSTHRVTEEEKAQADRYKQLLLKQRDIMIALTQRLVERDEQIMALQDELDAYDRRHKELEEKLDEKTASLIK
jgi:hypothetical protein